jgi:hypothetical protein
MRIGKVATSAGKLGRCAIRESVCCHLGAQSGSPTSGAVEVRPTHVRRQGPRNRCRSNRAWCHTEKGKPVNAEGRRIGAVAWCNGIHCCAMSAPRVHVAGIDARRWCTPTPTSPRAAPGCRRDYATEADDVPQPRLVGRCRLDSSREHAYTPIMKVCQADTAPAEAASQCVCFNLRKAARAVTQFYDATLAPSGVQRRSSPSWWRCR